MAASGCALFCGSIVLPNEEDNKLTGAEGVEKVLRTISAALPHRLARLPDGEVGRFFCLWQLQVFLKTPWVCADFALGIASAMGVVPSPSEIQAIGKPEDIVLGDTDFDTTAIQSYQVFKKLKNEGVIDSRTRFQVCLPTPLNIVAICVREEFRKHVEPMYEELVVKAVKNILTHIPHDELAIQWDCPMEMLFLEGSTEPWTPYFEISMSAIVERLVKMAAPIHRDVELGFHLCYGDLNHRHFLEPKNTALMVNLANHIASAVQRPINWVHMPVPIDRKDDAYYMPLTALQLHSETELYLGVVHADDLEGTKERIAVAQRVLPGLKFGVATECGLGRTPASDVSSILDILRKVSAPVASISSFTTMATAMKHNPDVAVEEVNQESSDTAWQGTFW